jgi:hypothetical protein
MKRQDIINQIEGWISDMETQCGDRRTGRAISLNAMALKVVFILLVSILCSHQYDCTEQTLPHNLFRGPVYCLFLCLAKDCNILKEKCCEYID